MRNQFDVQLHKLNDELVEMGELVKESIENAATAFDKDNPLTIDEIADKSSELEQQTDEKEKEIESLCLNLLLRQQPVATDLRLVSSALKMITDLERIGDNTQDITNLAKSMRKGSYADGKPYLQERKKLLQMANTTTRMVNDSIRAFVERDVNLALEVRAHDDIVDELFVSVRNDLIKVLREDIESGERAIDLLMVAKYFERIGDHIENVAEWVIFSILGKRP